MVISYWEITGMLHCSMTMTMVSTHSPARYTEPQEVLILRDSQSTEKMGCFIFQVDNWRSSDEVKGRELEAL